MIASTDCLPPIEADGSVVALKCIKPRVKASEGVVTRFRREASTLKYPRIVRYLDQGNANGQLYFAMDYSLLTRHAIYDLPKALNAQMVMILQDPPIPIQSRRSDIPSSLAGLI